jgi:hypothetical protein
MSRSGLKQALGRALSSGVAATPRALLAGCVVGVPVGCYYSFDFAYSGGMIVVGPAAIVAGGALGGCIGFLVGAMLGLRREGYAWLIPLVPILATGLVLAPYALYLDWQSRDNDYKRLVLALRNDDPLPFLAELREGRNRGIVRAHLEQFLVCAAAHAPEEVVDALAALDPHRKEGYALCAAAEYGRPSVVRHLLREGYSPKHAHRLSGWSCAPIAELVEASDATPPCSLSMFGDFDQFSATPSPAGCSHRAEVIAMLVDAGASGAPVRLTVCEGDAGALDAR